MKGKKTSRRERLFYNHCKPEYMYGAMQSNHNFISDVVGLVGALLPFAQLGFFNPWKTTRFRLVTYFFFPDVPLCEYVHHKMFFGGR
jgi:hypothetical protein